VRCFIIDRSETRSKNHTNSTTYPSLLKKSQQHSNKVRDYEASLMCNSPKYSIISNLY